MTPTRAAATAALVLLALTGCNDRVPWQHADATHVTIWRNGGGAPGMATYCLGNHGFSATLTDPPVIERLYDLDITCNPKPDDPHPEPEGPS